MKALWDVSVVAVIACLSLSAEGVEYNFNDNKKPAGWEEFGGKWSVKNGEYCGEEPGGVEGATLFGDANLTDVVIQATVKNAQGAWMALNVRWQDVNNQYGWWVNLANNSAEWWVKLNGTYVQDASGPVAVDRNQYRLKAVVKGDTFEGYYNDKLVATMKRSDLKQGQVGMLVWQGSACFDDLSLTGKGIEGLAVRPATVSLPVVWGNLKRGR